MKPLLLIIDDDKEFISDFIIFLENDFNCISANDAKSGLYKIKSKNPDAVLLDLMFKRGENGIEILKKIKSYDKDLPVLMITDYASVDTAIEAIKLGAVDYISKTPNLNGLKLTIEKSIKQRIKNFRNETFIKEINENFREIIGSAPATLELKKTIELYAQNDNTILITGESGVGKELVARKIHSLGEKSDKPFIAVNCAALPKDLIESELFGHERGAFTGADKRKPGKFEIAEDGTIFLDEISELNLNAQVKLLRILQEKEFERVGGIVTIRAKCRILAATNRDLKKLADTGKFREDLFYRLDVLPIFVPPLRERIDDIPDLVKHFANKSAVELKIAPKEIPAEIIAKFKKYNWPGNIRELQNYVTRMMIIPDNNFNFELPDSSRTRVNNFLENIKVPETWEEMNKLRKDAADRVSREVEKLFLENLLDKFNGNISKAAEFIGINRTNLHKMIKKCGL